MREASLPARRVELRIVDLSRRRRDGRDLRPSLAFRVAMGLELDDRPYDFDRQMLDAVEKIGVADVERAAKRCLVPEALTIAIFGSPTPEEQAILKERHALEVVPRETVFTGGYDAPAPAKPQPVGAGAH